MRSKEEVKLLINEQEEISEGVQKRLGLLRQELTDVAEVPKREAYVGRFFKDENSSGGGRWPVYYRVTKALRNRNEWAEIMAVVFEKDALGEVTIGLEHRICIPNIGEEITEAEYLEEWSKLACEADIAVRGMR